MPNNDTTTKFKVDISELKKAMQEAKQNIAVANSEFEEAKSRCDDWSKSSEGLTAKLQQLSTRIKNQRTILNALEQQYKAVVEEQGEGSKAAQDLQIKINKQKAAINNTQKEISKFNDSLISVTKAEKAASKTGRDVTEVLDDMGKKTKNAEGGFTALKGAVATFAGNVMSSFIGKVKEGINTLFGLAEETREYRSEMAKLDTAFTTNGHSADKAKKTYKDLYAILGDEGQAVEAANHLAILCDNEKDLAQWTRVATGIYGTFGSSLPVEGLTEAANETAKTAKLTGSLADALNWAGVNEDDFQKSLDSCNSEQERQKLILSTLNSLYSDAATAYEKNNKSVIEANKANSDYTDTVAKMGEKIEPITTAVKNGFNKLLKKILELTSDADMSEFTSMVEEGFSVLIDKVLPAVIDGLGWIIDNKDIVIAGLAGIAAGFVAFKVASLIQTVTTALQGMTAAQWLLNVAMNANPIGIIVMLIAGLIAAIVALWNNSESFRKAWNAIWDSVGKFFKGIWDSIVKFFTETIPNAFQGVIDWIKQNWQSILLFLINPFAGLFKYFYDNNSQFKDFVDNAVKSIKELPGKIGQWLKETINKVASWGRDLVEKGKQAASDLVTGIVNKIKEIVEKVKNIGKEIVEGLWNGIKSMGTWIGEKIKGFGSDVLDGLKDFFQIKSPSKRMEKEVGYELPRGIAVGVKKRAKSALSSMKDLAVNMIGAARDGMGKDTENIGNTGINSVLSTVRNRITNTVGAIKVGLSNTKDTLGAVSAGSTGGVVNNFTQVINSPKQLSRLDIYRQSKNLLNYAGGKG